MPGLGKKGRKTGNDGKKTICAENCFEFAINFVFREATAGTGSGGLHLRTAGPYPVILSSCHPVDRTRGRPVFGKCLGEEKRDCFSGL